MNFFLDSALLGLEYALLAVGVYITFRILNLPDLTVDGSFTFGTNDTAGAQKYFDFLAEENAYADSHDKVIHTAPVAKDISTDEFLK